MTTIWIDKQTHREVKVICKTLELTLGEFVKHSTSYFRKTGIDPSKSESESPYKSIKELEKRMGQVVGFIKTHEQEKLNPLFEHLIILTRKLGETMQKLPASERFDQVIKGVNYHANMQVDNHKKQMAFLMESMQKIQTENKRELTALTNALSALQQEQKELRDRLNT